MNVLRKAWYGPTWVLFYQQPDVVAFSDVVSYYKEDTGESLRKPRECWLLGKDVHAEGNYTHDGAWSVQWMDASQRSQTDAGWRALHSNAPCSIPWMPLQEPRCVIATVSVLPMRLAHFKHSLRSILRQSRPPDLVYIVLPMKLKDRSKRLLRRTYPNPLPAFLFRDPRVRILRPSEEDDLGTLDMLVPTLRELRTNPPPGCVGPHRVWVVNDDVHYDPGLLEALLACTARHPDAACGSTGGRSYDVSGVMIQRLIDTGIQGLNEYVAPHLQTGGEIEVEVLQSYGSLLYRTDFFGEDFLHFPEGVDEVALMENDWWFAGYLRSRGIRLLHLPAVRPWWRATESWTRNALSWRWWRIGHNPAKDAAIKYFADRHNIWRTDCLGNSVHDTSCKGDIALDILGVSQEQALLQASASQDHAKRDDVHDRLAQCLLAKNLETVAPRIPDRLLFNCVEPLCPRGTNLIPSFRENVMNTISMHPGADVTFHDEKACKAAIAHAHSETLAEFFENETEDPRYKSDLCRLAMLYEHGGYYFDNDMVVLSDVRRQVPSSVTFSTCIAYSDNTIVFQSFLAATPCNPIIYRALQLSFQWYQWDRRSPSMRKHAGLMGPVAVGKALRNWLGVSHLNNVGHLKGWGSGRPYGEVYLFEEKDNPEDYSLKRRQHEWIGCNLIMAGNHHAIAWSRECRELA